MADFTLSTVTTTSDQRGIRTTVFINRDTGYYFHIGTGSDLDYLKTTNGGKTWGVATDVFTGTVEAFDVWYDQWTPGDTGRNIHIWLIEGGVNDDVIYKRFNTVNDTQTQVTILDATSTSANRGQFISGTKTRGGNLLCAFDIDAGAETGFYRSLDNGATWAVRTNPIEVSSVDQCFLFPANVADPNDAWLLYDDVSTDELTLKEYDDSGNSFTESAALTMAENTTDNQGQYGFAGSIRHSDGHLIVAYMDAYDVAGASDFKVYDINGTGSLTALTDIATNVDDIYFPSVFLNQDQPDWIYVAYVGKSDGSEVILTTASVYYALSKDRGLTWTKDIAYSTSSTDYKQARTPPNGERFWVSWSDFSATDQIANYEASKEFGFTPLNNYQSLKATGYNNTGIISTTERIR